MFSERVSIHFTGRPSLRASAQHERLLAVGVELRAEAAADVGRDHAQVVLADPERSPERMKRVMCGICVDE